MMHGIFYSMVNALENCLRTELGSSSGECANITREFTCVDYHITLLTDQKYNYNTKLDVHYYWGFGGY